jgi:nucleoid-associated protein
MAIEQIVLQHLGRSPDDAPVQIEPIEGITAGADMVALFSQYKRVFNAKPGKRFGKFQDDFSAYPAASLLNEVIDGKLPFKSFCEKISAAFATHAIGLPFELDTHILYVLESIEQGQRLFVLFLETESGFSINKHEGICASDHLSLTRLDMGAKIDITEWRGETGGENNYFTLLTNRTSAKAGEAFTKALGFTNALDIEQDTATFLDAIERFAANTDDKEAAVIKKKAYDFCVEQHKLGDSVRVAELAEVVDESAPSRFKEFAKANLTEFPDDLRPDYRKLKRLVKFTGKGNGMSLSFSSDLIQNSIVYDEASNTLTILEVPKTLKQQLLEYFHKKNASGE